MKRFFMDTLKIFLFIGIALADPPRTVSSLSTPGHVRQAMTATHSSPHKVGCPRREDIHPCECLEIPNSASSEGIETVAFCKTIRNAQVLQNAMKGMQGHVIDFMVLDSCKLPPFPNGLFFNVGIKWMEIINSTVQMKQNFFQCATIVGDHRTYQSTNFCI